MTEQKLKAEIGELLEGWRKDCLSNQILYIEPAYVASQIIKGFKKAGWRPVKSFEDCLYFTHIVFDEVYIGNPKLLAERLHQWLKGSE